jgi:hypothetical protein
VAGKELARTIQVRIPEGYFSRNKKGELKMLDYQTKLKSMHACNEALEWLRKNDYPTLNDAWQVCERGDWMLWLAGKMAGEPMSDTRKPLVLAACECVRLALPYVKLGETAPLAAIELAEKWARGGKSITAESLQAAVTAADAYATAAVYAADSTATSVAAVAATAAAYAADSTASSEKTLKKCADIVRKYYPIAPEN